MIEDLTGIVFFGGLIVLGYFHYRNKHEERMYMLENNISSDFFGTKNPYKYNFWLLRIGALLIGASLGYLFGDILNHDINDHEDAFSYMSLVFLFTGIAWVIEFMVEKRIIDKSRSND
ncbi:MAG: hypothetical protein Kapaf2KO_18680 [Candidatus Kapaibacteriales bacterium]